MRVSLAAPLVLLALTAPRALAFRVELAFSDATSVRRNRAAQQQRHRRCAVRSSALSKTLFIEIGTGCDQHGQDCTKAAVRACRNAIEWNSLPAMRELIPGGYDAMRLRVQLAVPYPDEVDEAAVRSVFPYGAVEVELSQGGASFGSGVALAQMGDGDGDDSMRIAIAAVSVGY